MFSKLNPLITRESVAQLLNELGLLLATRPHLVLDSRCAGPGMVFCAYPGTSVDGRNFIPQAISQGVSQVLWEPGINFNYAIENFPVANLRHMVGILAAASNAYPSQFMRCIAVTGTNGKTSISHWLNQAYTMLGQKAAIIGTTGAGIYPQVSDYAATTPDPITLQTLLAKFKSAQVEALVMEVSSHALDQGRINGVEFTTAIFTNLTQDHLDYHLSMDNYFQAKEQLFYWHSLKHAVVNLDDAYATKLLAGIKRNNPQIQVLTYGLNDGELRATNIQLSPQGLKFSVTYQGREQIVQAKIIGRFNIYNLLAVIGTLLLSGLAWSQIPQLVTQFKPVVGRMDAEIIPGKPLVVVDYSHTPDALEKALATLAEIKGSGRLICVFGCGGNRDRGKRPLMGKIATQLADLAIVTTDNPRLEEPSAIIQDIVADLAVDSYQIICDRRQAIVSALAMAQAQDIVLIAGKGHENYQDILGVKHHFSDLELVAEVLHAS